MYIKKAIIIISTVGLLSFDMAAQVKKPASKSAAKPAASASKSTSGNSGVNAGNYGKVVSYLNSTIDCMNEQSTAIADRRNPINQMYDFYVKDDYRDGLGKKLDYYVPGRLSFNYADEKAGQTCLDVKPPTFMSADDIRFYTTNYQALKDVFIVLTKHWNDVASAVEKNGVSNYSKEAGKKKAEAIEADMEKYYEIRKAIGARTKTIQKAIFPFSVDKSPDKKQYINMHDDLIAIEDFSYNISSFEEIEKNKETIARELGVIEDAVIKHGTEMPPANGSIGSFNYKSFYSNVNDYIKHTKEILNGTIREKDQAKMLERNNYFYKSIIRSYNSIMSR
ncbi:hypothetical protein ACTJIJ_24880 [Niabella sp. 22666]|uniref:hypothetical protein n=1 Tax=Niabella sp. 22666 TaxID=3453954 RepID=UPI003F861F09